MENIIFKVELDYKKASDNLSGVFIDDGWIKIEDCPIGCHIGKGDFIQFSGYDNSLNDGIYKIIETAGDGATFQVSKVLEL